MPNTDHSARHSWDPFIGIVCGLLFYPLGYFIYYRNWKYENENKKARIQIFLFVVQCFIVTGFLVYQDKKWGAAGIFFWLLWAIFSYKSMARFATQNSSQPTRKSTTYEAVQFICFAAFFFITNIVLLIAHDATKIAIDDALTPNHIREERAKEEFLTEISGVWGIPATNESFEIHFEIGKKWVKKGNQSFWIDIQKVAPEEGYVVFSVQGENEELNTIKKINNGSSDSFTLSLSLSGQSAMQLQWIRSNM